MPADDLKKAIESYEKLIANYTLARSRMIEANARTVAALRRALEISHAQLKLIEEGRT